MFDLLSPEQLQSGSSSFSVLLATWLIWPVLCGILGARKGVAGRGIMNGLFWGPIGLVLVLLAERKYVCPTCGQKTLKTSPASDARPILALEIPPPRTAPPPVPVPTPAPAPVVAPQEPFPMKPDEREKLIAAACAGYDAEEEARLRSWLNSD